MFYHVFIYTFYTDHIRSRDLPLLLNWKQVAMSLWRGSSFEDSSYDAAFDETPIKIVVSGGTEGGHGPGPRSPSLSNFLISNMFFFLERDGEMQDVSRRHATVPGPPSLPVSSKRHGSWPRWFTLPNLLACSSFAKCFLWRYTRHVPTSTSRTNMTIIWCQYSRYRYIFIPKHHVKCFAWWIDLELMVQSCTSDVPKPPQVISRLSSLMGWTSNLKLVSQIGKWQPSISTQMCLGRCCFHLSASTTSTTICRSWLGFEGSCSGLGLAVCETGSNNGHYKK